MDPDYGTLPAIKSWGCRARLRLREEKGVLDA